MIGGFTTVTIADIYLEAAIWRGFGSRAPDWEFTAPVTFGFKLVPAFHHQPGS